MSGMSVTLTMLLMMTMIVAMTRVFMRTPKKENITIFNNFFSGLLRLCAQNGGKDKVVQSVDVDAIHDAYDETDDGNYDDDDEENDDGDVR